MFKVEMHVLRKRGGESEDPRIALQSMALTEFNRLMDIRHPEIPDTGRFECGRYLGSPVAVGIRLHDTHDAVVPARDLPDAGQVVQEVVDRDDRFGEVVEVGSHSVKDCLKSRSTD